MVIGRLVLKHAEEERNSEQDESPNLNRMMVKLVKGRLRKLHLVICISAQLIANGDPTAIGLLALKRVEKGRDFG